jgi:hypothetical protein
MSVDVGAQVSETVGTRALGMAGAFVAVADDATATFWNPAGLATGPAFDLLVGNQEIETLDPDKRGVGEDSFMMAVGTPPLGLAYYRIRTVSAVSLTAPDLDDAQLQQSALTSLTTHHFGATFVQSLASFLAVGTTLKIVRGTVALGAGPGGTIARALDLATDLDGRTKTKIDLDAGLMAVFGAWRAGVVGRNLRELEFEALDPGDRPSTAKLSRQFRAGVAYAPRSRPRGTNGPMTLAADLDLQAMETPFGDRRELAVGGEGWWWAGRIGARAGIRLNTLRDQFTSQDPVVAVGMSISPRAGSLVEAQITRGRNELEKGWGISARVTF